MTDEQLERQRARQREWARKHRAENPERVRAIANAYQARHRDKRLALARDWKARNKDRVREYRKKHWRENRAHSTATNRAWVRANPERIKEMQRRDRQRNGKARAKRRRPQANADKRLRYATQPRMTVAYRLRAALTQALRRARAGKTASTFALVGCSVDDLLRHLERLFVPGMSWENRAAWHVDHIRPIAGFDLTDPAQQRACFHWSNLQPLWREDNLRKGAR